MKKILFYVLLILMYIPIYAQEIDSKESNSELVEFFSKDGVFLRKDFYDVGSIGGIEFKNVIFTYVATGEKRGGMRISTSSSTGEKIGIINGDELDKCIEALEYIKDVISQPVPENDVEFQYTSNDGMRIGAYVFLNLGRTRMWRIFIQLNIYNKDSSINLKPESMERLITIIKLSREKLRLKLIE